MTIYVVMDGHTSDSPVAALFSMKQLAEAYATLLDEPRCYVGEFELDEYERVNAALKVFIEETA